MTSRKIPESAVENLVSDLEGKANASNTVTTNTDQTISGVKTFNSGTLQALRPILLKEDNANEGGQIYFERSDNSVLKPNPCIDLYANTIRVVGTNSKNAVNITLQVDLENNQVWVPTPATTANDTQAATTAWVRNFLTPTGTIIIWSAPTPPAGYLICDGAAISRTTYAALFQVIGTTWGAGDGNTTFNLPNFVDRYPVGLGTLGTVGTLLGQGLPNITGSCTTYELGVYQGDTQNGALGTTQSVQRGSSGHGSQAININLDASKSNAIYGASNRVQPFSSVVCFCIRY